MAGVLEYFRKMCLKIYEPGTAIFLLAPGLGWQASWKKKIKAELELLKDTDMLLMVENWIRGGINGLKSFKDPKAFTDYWNDVDDI